MFSLRQLQPGKTRYDHYLLVAARRRGRSSLCAYGDLSLIAWTDAPRRAGHDQCATGNRSAKIMAAPRADLRFLLRGGADGEVGDGTLSGGGDERLRVRDWQQE